MRSSRVAIIHYAAPPIVGGVESTIYHHARLLFEAGLSVEVIAGRGDHFYPGVNFHRIPEVDSRHPAVMSINEELNQGRVTSGFEKLRDRLVRKLRTRLAGTDACIVHNAASLHKNLALSAALRLLSEEAEPAMVAWCHDFAWHDKIYASDLHPGYPWDLLRTRWPAVHYVVVSAHRRSRLRELPDIGEDDVHVINPGVDIFEFLKVEALTRKLVTRLNLLKADPLMLLPARITRRKNIQFAIEVAGGLVRHKPQTRLVVTGPPGPHNPKNVAYLASLKGLAADSGIKEQVHFLYEHGESGEPLYLSDAVIADFYQLADLLLFPSAREGFGIPVLEAGLIRLPIFASDIPSFRESSADFAHLFDPNGDPLLVAESILSNLEMNTAHKLRRRIIDHYSWEAIVNNRLIPLLTEVIDS